MTDIPETSRAVVYDPDTGGLDVRRFAIRPVRPGEILGKRGQATFSQPTGRRGASPARPVGAERDACAARTRR